MGVLYPRLGVLTLKYSTAANQGFNSSALSISDSTGSAITLAATAIVFAALAPLGGAWAFAGVFAVTGLLCVAAFAAGPRILRPVGAEAGNADATGARASTASQASQASQASPRAEA
ncbi:MAG TPA: hypothetical protein VGP57_01230 [Actinoplanes sp.]|nr:hypothetical protein [Actinoplanes sp.]